MKKQLSLLLLILLMGCRFAYMPPSEAVAIPTFEAKKPIHVALVLGGGGAKGLALLGAIKELEAAGITPDLIVGCSAGAMAGALYADGQELAVVEKTFLALKRSDILDFSYFKPLFGIVNGTRLQDLMKKNLHAKTFEELKTPLIVVATDLQTGETIEICHGEIASAVRASCAFPGVFKPVLLFGRHLIDGGASCPVPVSVAKKHGAEVVIAIDVTGKLPSAKPRHLFGIGKRSLDIAYRKFIDQSLESADIVVKMDFEDTGTFNDGQNEQLFELGRKTVRDLLPEIQKKLAEHQQK